jgi:hypothetical protein
MKKMLLISCVMLALTATAAMAASGLNFSWGPLCASDGLIPNKDFVCNTNSGSNVMVGSFVPTASHELLLAIDGSIDGQTTVAVMPDWWQFKNTGACRLTALGTNAAPGGTPVICQDPWVSQGTAGIAYYGDVSVSTIPTPMPAGNRARIKLTVATGSATASPVAAGTEYFGFNVTVSNAKTVGTGACAGCSIPMAWVFNGALASYMDAGALSDETIITPILNNCISWQGGGAGLCQATPAKNTTWGQVKSLYR